MNYYGLFISFSDDSARFYDPARRDFFAFPAGELMPRTWFIRDFDFERHYEIAANLVAGFCMDNGAAFLTCEIRPGAPYYQSIAAALAAHTQTHGVN